MAWRTQWLVVLGAAFLALAVGCTEGTIQQRPDVSQLEEGLTILKAEPTWGVNAAYVKDRRGVFVETRVGYLRPEIYRLTWPDDPTHEMDFRVLDQKGRVIIVQRGGDTFVDPSWDQDIGESVKAYADINPEERTKDIELAWEALGVAATSLPEEFKEHVHYFRTLGSRLPFHRDPEMMARLQELASRADPGPKTSPSESAYASTYYGAPIYVAGHAYRGEILNWGDHTAVNFVYSFDGWQTGYIWVYACNHGRCSYESGMNYRCVSGGSWVPAASWDVETNSGGNKAVSGGCRSPYSWFTYTKYWWGSTGDKNTHDCNDDAAYELWQAKEGTAWTSRGDMYSFNWKDPNGHRYACYCNSDHHCDGDWSSPKCP